MRRLICAVFVATLASACIVEDDSSLTVVNDSSYVLFEAYLAHESDPSWGPNMLGGPLFPGEEIVIGGIDCGTYDLLVVDETNLECEIRGIDLCFEDGVWFIDDQLLDICAFG